MLANSQNEQDALRFSRNYYGSTARSIAMGGAFGALGGDLASLSINPAGIAIYRSNEFSISPTLFLSNIESDYFGSTYLDTKYNFNFNNIGFVTSYNASNQIEENGDRSEGWMNTNFAIGYNRLNNFHGNTLIEGINSQSSIVDLFYDEVIANNIGMDEYGGAEGYADLVYDTDPLDGTTNYQTDFQGFGYGELQTKSIRTEGAIGEYFLSFGANYSHKLYIGGTIGLQSLRYEEISDHDESDQNDIIGSFISMNYHERLYVKGSGVNLKLGLMYRFTDMIRMGIAFHTPTFYNIEEEFQYSIYSNIEYNDGPGTNSFKSAVNYSSYELTTPFKVISSLGFVIKKYAIVSIDYEYVDYTTMRMRSDDYSYTNENKNIGIRYSAVSNLRFGTEFRYGPFRFRGGYAFYGSPYDSSEENSDSNYNVYSAGFGIKDKNFYVDFTYQYADFSEKYYLYGTEEADVLRVNNQIITTIGFKF